MTPRLQMFCLASAAVVIALASAGCIGSTSRSTSNGRSDHSGLIHLNTALTISYRVPTCPPGARCALITANGPKYYRVSRQLLCSPDGGDYDNPAAVCRALTDVVTKLKQPHGFCSCPPQLDGYKPPKAVGFYMGTRRTIQLDACSLCGLPGIGADLKLLLPGGLPG